MWACVALRHCQADHAFPIKHLINQAVVQFHGENKGEDEFTDSTHL